MTLPWERMPGGGRPLSALESPVALPQHRIDAILEPIIVLGAGLAGCWLARLLAERGIRVTLIEQHRRVAMEASGNPAGIIKPYVSRAANQAMDFHLAAYAFLQEMLVSLHAHSVTGVQVQACGVLQLVTQPYPDSPHYHSVSPREASRLAGLPLHAPALHFPTSGWLTPDTLCRFLVDHPLIVVRSSTRVESVQPCSTPDVRYWQVTMKDRSTLWSRRLVLACGSALSCFEQTRALPVIPARGQISRFRLTDGTTAPRCVVNGNHYVIPDGDSILAGATFDRLVALDDTGIREKDHIRNLAGLQQLLPGLSVCPTALAGHAGVRATTPDRLPMAGPAPDLPELVRVYAELTHGRSVEQLPALPCLEGLYVLGGFGSRGITTAPLAACALADLLMHILPQGQKDWIRLLNPARFFIRDLKRGKVRLPTVRQPSD